MATTIRGQEASDYPEDLRFMADDQALPFDPSCAESREERMTRHLTAAGCTDAQVARAIGKAAGTPPATPHPLAAPDPLAGIRQVLAAADFVTVPLAPVRDGRREGLRAGSVALPLAEGALLHAEADLSAMRALYHRTLERAEQAEADARDAHAFADEIEAAFDAYRAQAEASVERLATALRAVTNGGYHAGGRFIADAALCELTAQRIAGAALRDLERSQARAGA